jgi:hypothetical protein
VLPAQAFNTGTRAAPRFIVLTPANQAIDWRRDGDFMDMIVPADINDFGITGCGASPAQVRLPGYDDWANLQYSHRAAADFADGIHVSASTVEEITLDDALNLSH